MSYEILAIKRNAKKEEKTTFNPYKSMKEFLTIGKHRCIAVAAFVGPEHTLFTGLRIVERGSGMLLQNFCKTRRISLYKKA